MVKVLISFLSNSSHHQKRTIVLPIGKITSLGMDYPKSWCCFCYVKSFSCLLQFYFL